MLANMKQIQGIAFRQIYARRERILVVKAKKESSKNRRGALKLRKVFIGNLLLLIWSFVTPRNIIFEQVEEKLL